MCATYKPTKRERIADHFHAAGEEEDFVGTAFPGARVPIVRRMRDEMEIAAACFGMIADWADLKAFKHTYNARSETVASKPSFRNAWSRGQFCIVPADAIYEPNYESGKAVRWGIRHADDVPLGIAAIWDFRPDGPEGKPLVSFSMLTINADDHPLMRRFHKPGEEKRSVVMLEPQDYEAWLQCDAKGAGEFLRPYPAEKLTAAAVPEEAAKRDTEAPRQADLF